MVKALPWSFFVGSIGFATNSLTSNSGLVTKIYFPREIFPLSATLAQMFDTTIRLYPARSDSFRVHEDRYLYRDFMDISTGAVAADAYHRGRAVAQLRQPVFP